MTRKFRTAVLVVHGMGSQRPLETVRGVINAIWFSDDDHLKDKEHKLWSHPEPSGVDLDLTVMTTNEIPGTVDDRVADFHELYWAHQLSETKAVAVLLWLFELGRRGPRFRTGMDGLWWCGAIFISLLLLSVSFLVLDGVIWSTKIFETPYDILVVLALMIFVGMLAGFLASLRYLQWALAGALFVLLAIAVCGIIIIHNYALFAQGFDNPDPDLALWTNAFFAPGLAFLAAWILMGLWGVFAFLLSYVFSVGFFVIYLLSQNDGSLTLPIFLASIGGGHFPWGLTSTWSQVAAWTIIGMYIAMDLAFLQPYLGDAARYFRNSPANVAVRRAIRKNAVDTLDQLHRSRDYDRIVVVAHSLGTVVAYDMLRAYYSRICSQIPADKPLKQRFAKLNAGTLNQVDLRAQGRQLVHALVTRSKMLKASARRGRYKPATREEVDAWLVTDFVTLGSPLTHAKYLMSNAKSGSKLEEEFTQHVLEREYPTCPPQLLDTDGLIFFSSPHSKEPRVHHGGVFGVTRWTNLFFPLRSVLWGDAIGGPVAHVFCPYGRDGKEMKKPLRYVKDVPVSTRKKGLPGFFRHIAYWNTDFSLGRAAPHIAELRAAVNLEDT